MGSSRLYEEDFYAWANEQAGLLRVLLRPRLVPSKSASKSWMADQVRHDGVGAGVASRHLMYDVA